MLVNSSEPTVVTWSGDMEWEWFSGETVGAAFVESLRA